MEIQDVEDVDVETPTPGSEPEVATEVVPASGTESSVVVLSEDQFMALMTQNHEDNTALLMILAFVAGLKLLGMFWEGWRSTK
ncbi:hypothetical protein [Paenibacillus amylolyticus]|uniref:hypothetical protein n=1 Tax=Paenibacillus amylolyticus TaxID=1451 RepID=UPI00201D7907|nr:hypothetical protein [Paenibacillus amylolyticus]MCL6664555.1 hypothetical protein [Paenibacillus amylolyticus]